MDWSKRWFHKIVWKNPSELFGQPDPFLPIFRGEVEGGKVETWGAGKEGPSCIPVCPGRELRWLGSMVLSRAGLPFQTPRGRSCWIGARPHQLQAV